jgi:hypothetical protein
MKSLIKNFIQVDNTILFKTYKKICHNPKNLQVFRLRKNTIKLIIRKIIYYACIGNYFYFDYLRNLKFLYSKKHIIS